jgi:acyl-CoA synthetase (AMP-forming)/AMP-acid ligase II/pimeloyl-ACP methyl ester carboxylesterase
VRPADLPGLDPAWSRTLTVQDQSGAKRCWHVLDNAVSEPVGTLLCVHGNPTWSYLWRRLLATAPPGWRVVAPDHLGMGFSERLDAPRTLAERVRDLGDLTDALGVTGPVVTVGHDWGGAISLGWALDHREQLRGVVLTNTAVAQPPDDPGPVLIRLAHLPGVREAVCVRTPFFVRATSALSHPALPREVRRALAAPYTSAERRQAVGDFVADIPFAHRRDHPSRAAIEAIAEGVRSLDVPALFLWGPRDPVFGERYLADLRARMPHAELHRYEGASHLVTEDAPEYADAVAQWVTDLQSPDRTAPRTPDTAPRPGSGRTLWSALGERRDDASPAVVEVGGATVSWATLWRRVEHLSAGLAAAGVLPGHRVALLVEPSADLTAAVYALWRAGAVIVVADKGLGFTGMRRALRGAAVDHVIGARQGLAAARLMRLPGSRISVRALDELAERGRTSAAPAEPSPDAHCAVVFTSGATGPAKGVVYRHRQVLRQLDLLRASYNVTGEDRLVAAFAPFALLGPALGIGSAAPDIDVTAPATLTAAALGDAAAAIDATIVFASPAALRNVVATAHELSRGQSAALRRVRLVMSAGAPVPVSLLEALGEVLPNADAHTPYGMTEALPVTDVSLAELVEAGNGNGVCVGRPLPRVEVALSPLSADGTADGALTDEPERTGEICVRAAHVKDRYDALWATERASSRDRGWHRTGDVGHLDDSGRLWVEGRLAHVISTPTGVVTPVGIEQRTERVEGVRAAAVVGVGPAGTQALVVVVVPEVVRSGSGRRMTLEPAAGGLADSVRAAAGTEVAAVLVANRLPLDIRHASKIDRREVASRASRVLAGTRAHG